MGRLMALLTNFVLKTVFKTFSGTNILAYFALVYPTGVPYGREALLKGKVQYS